MQLWQKGEGPVLYKHYNYCQAIQQQGQGVQVLNDILLIIRQLKLLYLQIRCFIQMSLTNNTGALQVM